MIVLQNLQILVVALRNCYSTVWQIEFIHIANQHLNTAKQLAQRIYDIGNLEITRRDLMKHRREQEKVVAANQANLDRAFSRHQFLKMYRSINSAEAAAENDDSLFAWL